MSRGWLVLTHFAVRRFTSFCSLPLRNDDVQRLKHCLQRAPTFTKSMSPFVFFFFSDNVNVNLHFLAERFLREPTPTGWLLADRTSVSYWIGCIRYSGFVWVALVQGMHFMISVIDCDRVKCVVTKIYLRNPDILERTFLLNNAFSCSKFKSNMRSFITLQLLICPNYVYIYLWSKFFRSIKRCLYKFQYRYPPNLFKNHYKILIFYIVANII